MHFRAENVHVQIQLFADGFDVLETFLVIGTGATDPDLDFVFVEEGRDFAEGADDAFECACDLFRRCMSILDNFREEGRNSHL